MRNKLASALIIAASALYSQIGSAAVIEFSSQLSASQEVPPVQGPGKGSMVATLDTSTSQLVWKVTYSGLSGPVTAGHFHGPASKAANAGVAVGFKGSLDSPISGEATLTPAQMGELMGGMWYVNLHTAQNPKGEIRGQVITK